MTLLRNASLFIATALACTLAMGQNVYKCGNSYSQTPCSDGRTVDVSDPRSPAQKAQADAATRRDARMADALEKSRLRDEARQRAAHKPAPRATVPASAPAQKPGAAKPKAKKKEPAYFTAAIPGEKKPASPQPLKGAGSATR